MRILIDGTGLTGKGALADSIEQALVDAGFEVRVGRGCISSPRINAAAEWALRALRPGSPIALWLVGLGVLMDAFCAPRRHDSESIELRIGYIAEAIAVADALGHGLSAWLLRSIARLSVDFHVTICLTSTHLERVRRYLRASSNTPIERLVLTDPDRSLEIDRLHHRWHADRGATLLATEGRSQQELCHRALAIVEQRAAEANADVPVLRPAA